jgi:hypothetical protein
LLPKSFSGNLQSSRELLASWPSLRASRPLSFPCGRVSECPVLAGDAWGARDQTASHS